MFCLTWSKDSIIIVVNSIDGSSSITSTYGLWFNVPVISPHCFSNAAIFSFKRYENPSLHYEGFTKHNPNYIGLFDTKLSLERINEIRGEENEIAENKTYIDDIQITEDITINSLKFFM